MFKISISIPAEKSPPDLEVYRTSPYLSYRITGAMGLTR
jgi:hypothetical protein